MDARIVELPAALSIGSQITVAPLVARSDIRTSSATLYIERIPDSYDLLATINKFTIHGRLQLPYAEHTRTIDSSGRFALRLDGPDQVLDEIVDGDGLANKFLVFVDDEILSLNGATLVGPGRYSLNVIRARYGTAKAAHADNAEVFILPLADLRPLTHGSFAIGNTATFKLTEGLTAIEDADILSLALTGRLLNLAPPSLVLVNGRDAIHQQLAAAATVAISWVLPDAGAQINPTEVVKPATTIDFIVAGEIAHTEKVAWPAALLNLDWSEITALDQQPFYIRIRTAVDAGEQIITGRSSCRRC